jgi:hypothetical protein
VGLSLPKYFMAKSELETPASAALKEPEGYLNFVFKSFT